MCICQYFAISRYALLSWLISGCQKQCTKTFNLLFVGQTCSHWKGAREYVSEACSTKAGERKSWRIFGSHISRSEIKTWRIDGICGTLYIGLSSSHTKWCKILEQMQQDDDTMVNLFIVPQWFIPLAADYKPLYNPLNTMYAKCNCSSKRRNSNIPATLKYCSYIKW